MNTNQSLLQINQSSRPDSLFKIHLMIPSLKNKNTWIKANKYTQATNLILAEKSLQFPLQLKTMKFQEPLLLNQALELIKEIQPNQKISEKALKKN